MHFDIHIKHFGNGYNIFHLFKHLISKLEPEYYFLLESIDELSTEPLFSFICLEPNYILKIKDGHKHEEILTEQGEQILDHINSLELKDNSSHYKLFDDRSDYKLEALELLSQNFPWNTSSFPEIFPRRVFFGGFLGYLGYDIVAPVVGFKSTASTPDVMMGMHTRVLVYNHKTQGLFLIDNSLNKYEPDLKLEKVIRKYKERCIQPSYEDTIYPEVKFNLDEFPSNVTQAKFSEMVENTKEYIFEGDIFQAVISKKVSFPTSAQDLHIYSALRQLNPSPYMYYLNFGEFRIIGSSPEALVTIDQNSIHTVPIAGTRRRGHSTNDEIKMENELLNDPKEKAEHVMLVDLARNDLAKVSPPGSVQPTSFMRIKKYRHVMHLVTNLESKMRSDMASFDVVKSMFPAGTVSGAPKLRAMEIIQEIEVDNRGPYAGAVGYFALNGDCDLAITIRSLFLLNKTITAQAGGGIVADSNPRLEWIETKNKLQSVLTAVKMAEAS